MLGVQFFQCCRCATVYAGPDAPPFCADCDGRDFVTLDDRGQSAWYFLRPYDEGGESIDNSTE